MSPTDKAYGSEYHLGRYRRDAPEKLDRAILRAVGAALGSSIDWTYPSPETPREPQGMRFVKDEALEDRWGKVWPTSGRQQSWDGIAKLNVPDGPGTWLLIEAKANQPEFCSLPTTAKGKGRNKIRGTLSKVKQALGVDQSISWLDTYYQHANRLAALWFLNEHGQPAMYLDLLFMGDRFPDERRCPRTKAEWLELVEARRLTLGLPKRHALSRRIHEVCLPVLGQDG